MRTYVIVEMGSTPEGSLDRMLYMAEITKAIGADACKGQWLSSADRLAERRNAAEYRHAYRYLEYPRDYIEKFAERCRDAGVDPLVTCYLPEDVHVVAPHVARFKVASFEAGDRHFMALHDEWPDKPMIVSTGMTTAGQAREIADWLRAGDVLMHCVSAYPCPDGQASLSTIWGLLRSAGYGYSLQVGYSDHTRHPMAGALAVAAGAVAVEFHLRHPDCPPENADYEVARTVAEAMEYVRNIREAEALLGEPRSGPLEAEAAMLPYKVGG